MSNYCGCMDGPNDPDPLCQLCLGTGQPDSAWLLAVARKRMCPECSGRGYVDNPSAHWGTAEDGAEYCDGPEETDCPECHGVGFVIPPRGPATAHFHNIAGDDGEPF